MHPTEYMMPLPPLHAFQRHHDTPLSTSLPPIKLAPSYEPTRPMSNFSIEVITGMSSPPACKKRKMGMYDIMDAEPAHAKHPSPPSSLTIFPSQRRGSSRRRPATIARLKSGKDICVVAHDGVIDWLDTYFMYGFDANSIFGSLCPVEKGEWVQEELDYLRQLLHLIKAGKMRVPFGKSLDTYLSDRLHSDLTRMRKQLQMMQVHTDVPRLAHLHPMTDDETSALKDVKMRFLLHHQASVVDQMQNQALDQSWVLSLKQ
ncbi:hypothetical protein SPRG_13041 [Saprolegnia parasitica CBS 223.65]|uniref:Uncharacterized protein n=1 Tax=Saprolegnia parasitica (strain CBS 223.65) TaxID=695850 RepID=A0A067BTY9_SAPPC|nr:hypothetical protein SPRG_13041 [Saprolegnia parasitica CBS 223.65]KDO21703.1 hypothetical protein SPRG_13041 [Saprolegnia parasitica CBS 223.65]|eukprot:XP_012207624.1 hypothetical protein SPRG_13041 [Saprolegnia parasitica CBS 223.65]